MEAYVGASDSPDLDDALREFARGEPPQRVRELRREVEEAVRAAASPSSAQALLDTIALLGNYSLPGGIVPLQFLSHLYESSYLVGPAEPFVKPFDLLVVHAEHDREVAKRLIVELNRSGFTSLLAEVSQGSESIDGRIVSGIQSAAIVVVLWSRNAKSNPGLNQALQSVRHQIASRRQHSVVVVVDDEPTGPPIPFEHTVRLAGAGHSGLTVLRLTLESIRSSHELGAHSRAPHATQAPIDQLLSFYSSSESDLPQFGWIRGNAFKDVVIAPPDDFAAAIQKNSLMEILRSCRVRLNNWGGPSFPYDDDLPQATIQHKADGLVLCDNEAWPDRDWSFYFWRFTETCRFFQRADMDEDHVMDADGSWSSGAKVLGLEWALKDICMPLMFGQRLAVRLGMTRPLVVRFRWLGLAGRRMRPLRRRILPFRQIYEASENEFLSKVLVTRETDLQAVAESVVNELMWLFKWTDYDEATLGLQVESILSGVFVR